MHHPLLCPSLFTGQPKPKIAMLDDPHELAMAALLSCSSVRPRVKRPVVGSVTLAYSGVVTFTFSI